MRKRKKLQELTLKDNFMFGAVMVNEEICREFLELVLGFPIEKVTVSKEKTFVYHPEYRGIRLDVVASDEKHTRYNVEMQVQYKKNLGKRTRYYHGQIDMELLTAGLEYEHLPDSYVIFICDFDPFTQGKYKYTFEMTCKEDGKISLDDGNRTIFLNTHGKNVDEVPEGLVRFLQYVGSGATGNENGFVQKLSEEVQNVKKSREMEERYMLLEELIKEEREDAKAEGRTEGKAEGLAEAILILLERFGKLPEALRTRIRKETDPEVLNQYLKKAASAKSIEEFCDSIEQQK